MTDVRKGQAQDTLDRDEFRTRYEQQFKDPAFDAERAAIVRIEEIAWQAYRDGRKSPRVRKAGAGFADPDFELSVEWLDTAARLAAAAQRTADPSAPSRALVIAGADRNDGTCPGEMSKTFRLAGIVRGELDASGIETHLLDLSRIVSEFGKRIHPCKGCVSTAMPLCHWPCSCYPNYALGQSNDWMADIYEQWVLAHGIVIVTPTYWYQSPSALKLMIDRLVCADGGNPDPTTTRGKDPAKAKEVELAGWPYPKHLAGRTYGLVVHGDVAGIENQRRNLADWLDWMGLVDAGATARLDRYIGYYAPYATSHAELDRDIGVQNETRNVARAVAAAIGELRAGRLSRPDLGLRPPRPK